MMKHLNKLWMLLVLFLLLWLAFGTPPVHAGDVTLSWTNPDRTFTLVDAGAYTNPAGTKVYLEVADTDDPIATGITISDLEPGTYNFVVVAYSDTGIPSPVSGAATKEVTDFVVTGIVVKILVKIPGDFLLLGVGTVPLGTPCNTGIDVKGHYAVPFDDIVWSDPARNAGTAELPLVVVAKCG